MAAPAARRRLFDGDRGRLLRRVTAARHDHFQFGVLAGDRLILVRHDFTRGTSRVTSVEPGAPERTVLAGRANVIDVTPSPDGTGLLLGLRNRDAWRL